MKYLTLFLALFIVGCGEDEPVVATYDLSDEVTCPGARMSKTNDDTVSCTWRCADYEGETDKDVYLSFSKDDGGVWFLDFQNISDAGDVFCE